MTPTELSQVKHLLAVTSEVCDELFAPDEEDGADRFGRHFWGHRIIGTDSRDSSRWHYP